MDRGCEECKDERTGLCHLHPLTLILDKPVCRDGSIEDRAKYTVPWPLIITKSKFSLGKDGVWTRTTLPSHLLFGPYEGVYKEQSELDVECFNIAQLISTFIDISDSSFCNWLCLIAITPVKSVANLVPIIYKGSVFYKTVKSIAKDSELLVWTGDTKEPKTEAEVEVHNQTFTELATLDSPHQCPWCPHRFFDAAAFSEHVSQCSVVQGESEPPSTLAAHVPRASFPLRRSERQAALSGRNSSNSLSLAKSTELPRSDVLHTCAYCPQSYRSVDLLESHVQSHISEVKGGVSFECRVCDSVCRDRESVAMHLAREHGVTEMDYPEELTIDRSVFRTSLGSPPVLVEKDYNYHLGNEVTVFDLPWVRALLRMNKVIRQNKTSLKCSSCHTQFYNHFGAAIHERKCMDGRKPYKCGHCGKRFQLYFSTVKHMAKHDEAEREILGIATRPEGSPEQDFSLPLNLVMPKKDTHAGFSNDEGSSKGLPSDDPGLEEEEEEEEEEENDESPSLNNNWNEDDIEETKPFGLQSEFSQNLAHNFDTSECMTKIDISDSDFGGRRRRHVCNICGQRFYRRKHIKKHMELHQSETSRIYKCSFCNLWFGCSDMVQSHEQTVHANEPRAVSQNELSGEQTLLKRLLTLLAKEGKKGRYCEYFNAKETIKDKKYECEICSKKFTSFYRIRKHKVVAHSELKDMLEAANDRSELLVQELREGNIISLLSSIKEESEPEREDPTRVAQIQLTLLKQRSSTSHDFSLQSFPNSADVMSSLDRNSALPPSTVDTLTTSGTKIYVGQNLIDGRPTNGKLILPKGIDFQPLSASTPSQLQDEEMPFDNSESGLKYLMGQDSALTEPGYAVPAAAFDLKRVINETFASASYDSIAARHRQVYSEKDMKQCKICGKKLSPKTNMKTHLQSHTGERHYECQYCQKRYSLLSTLKRHIRIHTGDRPFKCNLCDKAYTQTSNLKRHYRQHTGERPFVCTFCPRRYAEKFSLNRHLKNHKEAKAHKCRFCRKGFSEQYLLVRHLQAAHQSC